MNKFKRKVKFFWHDVKGMFVSSYLCLKYPFLYPRNRFTGRHHNCWKLNNLICDINKEINQYEIDNGILQYEFLKNMKRTEEYHTTKFRYKYLKISKLVLDFVNDKLLQWIFFIPKYNELDAMPTGWRKAFGLQMCKEIKQALLRAGGRKMLHSYRIMQIKEKFGYLCWYDSCSVPEVLKIIEKYEYISFRTCIYCGRPAFGYSNGWIEPYCQECAEKNGYGISEKSENGFESFVQFGTKENDWYGYYSTEK